jgi:hypothetical protein
MVLVASQVALSQARAASAIGQLGARRSLRAALAIALIAPLSACGTDLGECYPERLGGSLVAPQAVHLGQDIVNMSCASSKCHSETAEGETRFGAPAELNFDVVAAGATPAEAARVARGGTNVVDWADQMWEQIEAGTMPPPAPGGPGELTPVQKEDVRNWLACGAEVITPTNIPVQPTWDSIWPRLANSCTSCHSPTTAVSGGMGFVLGTPDDMCGAYAKVFQVAPITNPCAMEATPTPLVVPNNPAGSLLLQKLKGTQTCGTAMPWPGTIPFVDTAPDVVTAIEGWITAGALKPPSCP